MKLSQPSQSQLATTIKQAIKQYTPGTDQETVTDFHLQAIQSSGEFTIINDDDKVLASCVIEEWMTYEGDDFYEGLEEILSRILAAQKSEGLFDGLIIMKPYSFVLIDEHKETIADLLLIDDDTLILNDELLKGLDEELDTFLKELLEK